MYKKVRAQHISIDLPTEESSMWVRIALQSVFKDEDYKTTQIIDRTGYVYREVVSVVNELETITDPVTGQVLTLSAGGCAEIVRKFIQRWMVEDCKGVINEHGDMIVKG